MKASLRLIVIATILATMGVPIALRYGTLYISMGYLTALVTIYMVIGQGWLWKSAPTVASAAALRTLLRGFWTASMVLSGLGLVAWLYLSRSLFLLLPLPFFVPTVLCTLFYEQTFRKVGHLPFRRKGL